MSVIKVNKMESTGTTAGGVEVDSSGHVTVDGQQMPTAGPLSHRNLVVNGAMTVAQRGTSSTASGYQTVDRFKIGFSAVSVTQSQQTLSSGSPYDEGFRNFLRLANTSTSSSTSSAVEIQYRVEAQDLAQSGWNYKSTSSYVTFSFWARSSLAGTYYATYRNTDASPLQFIKSFTLVADTWTKVTHTIPGGSNVVFNNDNGEGMRIMIAPHYGTSSTGSGAQLDAWHDRVGSDYFPDYAQNWSNTASATFDVTGVQLEVGEKATPFEHRSYGDELARCQRYYELVRGGGGMYWINGQSCGCVTYKSEKRDTPSTITASTVHYEYPTSSTWQAINITKQGFTTQRSANASYLIVDATWSVNAEL
tara:strand:+ start:747 stop:1835 length:1089 start_codon:yes stop_codon:yes gene_type:complete